MNDKLLTKEELIVKGYNFDALEMDPPSDQLFVRTGENGDDLVPVNGLVYELSEEDRTLLNYGEYEDGLPHGVSVDFHPNGRVKQIHTHFHGPIHGEQRQWDTAGQLVFWGEYDHGHELSYKRWEEAGNLIGEKTGPHDEQLAIIERSREFYRDHYGKEFKR